MQELRKLQQSFLSYLLEQESSIKEKITDQGSVDKTIRLHIYGNAYKLRLKESIETDHEVLGVYLGDDLFDLMVAGYISEQPSHYTSLRDFCNGLPDYLKATEPFSRNPIIAELARFERTLLFSFDTADAEVATLEVLQTIPQENWPYIKLRFHPSMQMFNAEWNSVQSWQALKQNQQPPAESQQANSMWLIWRNTERITEFRSLATDENAILNAFLRGANFAEVCEILLEYHSEEDVGTQAISYLTAWLDQRLITDFEYT